MTVNIEDAQGRIDYILELRNVVRNYMQFENTPATNEQIDRFVTNILLTQTVDNTAIITKRLGELEETLGTNQLAGMLGQGGVQ